MKIKLLCLSAVIVVAACASDPEVVTAPVTHHTPTHTPTPTPRPVTPVHADTTAPVYVAHPGSIEDFSTSAGDRIYFGYDSYTLSSEARAILSKQAAWLNSYPRTRVLLAGNCDERGTREYNLALGARRASSVKEYLVNMGVDPSRMTTISYGKERPIDPRSMGKAWSINRNTHTAIVSGAAS
ncbi:Tol-Pal system peptidoglycan-associated lipoprotein PAL [hydrothermal vent metagenome]|uniref:Tol-Pal system peptidoglycan-associated lipoprotein PAL n=1 Tax=hydrothermal vent metagenome TaxID=652676 RepID=A0A3B0R277_9ZZZZ